MYSKEELNEFANKLRRVGCEEDLVKAIYAEIVAMEIIKPRYSVEELKKIEDVIYDKKHFMHPNLIAFIEENPVKVKEILESELK